MFDNIGRKIKTLASVICWAGIIVSVIIGFICCANKYMVTIGFIIMIVGSLVSWIGSFALYGFGQLIDNSDKTLHILEAHLPLQNNKGNIKESHKVNRVEHKKTWNDKENGSQPDEDSLVELDIYIALLERGDITQKEFEEKRKELLNL